MNSKQLKTLKRHRQSIRKLGNRRIALKHKRAIINQKGGFIRILASFVLPLLASLLKK